MSRQRWPTVLAAGLAALLFLPACEGTPAPAPDSDPTADPGPGAPAGTAGAAAPGGTAVAPFV